MKPTQTAEKPTRTGATHQNLIIIEGIRGEVSIVELYHKYAITIQTYYAWNKWFIEAGKRQLSGDVARKATPSDV